MKKLPIGISDFNEILTQGFYYVDKTELIAELINTNAKVVLLPRPRRFGKTLNLSMLYYFFAVEEKHQTCFAQCKIAQHPVFERYHGQYPVIFLSFKDVKGKNFEYAVEKIKYLIETVFSRYSKVITCLNLETIEQQHLNRIISGQASQIDLETSIQLLSKLLTTVYEQPCIVLIDEYDTPIQTGFLQGYYEEIVAFFKTFLGAVLKDNDKNLYKAVITGILRVSKESIFSDLNNIGVYTLLDEEFSQQFGFTIDEVKKLLADYQLQEHFTTVNQWYNGYQIGSTTIFNPWSLLCYTDRKRLDVYWANTSSNGIIRTLVENTSGFRDDLKYLLKGETVTKVINPNITFKDKDFHFNENMLYSFLYFSGYLKSVNKTFDKGKYVCDMAIVNLECQYIFETIIADWVTASFSDSKLRMLLKALTTGNLPLFERIFSEFVRDTLSFFDTGKNVESVYHAFFLGLLVNLSDYEVISNQEAGYGRVDIMLLPKQDKQQLAIVMELKTIDEFMQESKDKALTSAVKQIEEKDYLSAVMKRGYANVLAFGVVFDGKRVWVKTA